MAHQIESMFYRGETPWHGLGRQVIEAPTTKEAIVAAGLDWKVNLVATQTVDGRPLQCQAMERDTDKKILGWVGPRYHPLQNAEAFQWFDPLVSSGLVSLETAGSLQGGKKVFVLARITGNSDVGIVGDDVVRKYILLSNSHDGSLAVRAGFTPVRVVCANTLAMAHNDGESQLIRLKHSRNIVANLDALRDTINIANQAFEATADQFRLLAQRQINAADLKKYVKVCLGYGATNDDDLSTKAESQIADVIALFDTGAGNAMTGVKGTVWAAYNAVTDYLSHSAGVSSDTRYTSLWFGENSRRNRAALDAAIMLAAA